MIKKFIKVVTSVGFSLRVIEINVLLVEWINQLNQKISHEINFILNWVILENFDLIEVKLCYDVKAREIWIFYHPLLLLIWFIFCFVIFSKSLIRYSIKVELGIQPKSM